MPIPTETVWDAPQHTLAKIEILRRYLQAWFPIVGRYEGRVLYIDGFAGPGEYKPQGQQAQPEGSPVIAIRQAVEHQDRSYFQRTKLSFIFIEKSEERAEYLRLILSTKFPSLPKNFYYYVTCQEFSTAMREVLRNLEQREKQMSPAFVFIDPFGWEGVDMEVIQKILQYKKTEVMVSFMFDSVNRFLGHPNQRENFNKLFGSNVWADLSKFNGEERKEAVLDRYLKSLKEIGGAKYTLNFEMINHRNHTAYYLIHCSSDDTLTAVSKMKDAMWKVDPTGSFSFSDLTAGQLTLLTEPDYEHLRSILTNHFSKKTVTWEQIRRFVLLETPYREAHIKRNTLAVMERSEKIKIIIPPGVQRKPYTYPNRIKDLMKFYFE